MVKGSPSNQACGINDFMDLVQEALEGCHYPQPIDPAARGTESDTPPLSIMKAWVGGAWTVDDLEPERL